MVVIDFNIKQGDKMELNNYVETFNNQGYLIIPDFINLKTCQQLIQEQEKIIDSLNHQENARVIFDTGNQEHAQNQYFFDSARKISFFYEKDAFNNNGEFIVPLHKAINKIGHALHDYNETFRVFSYQEKIKALLLNLSMEKPQIVQSMYLLKQPKIGNKVDLHQDSSYIYTQPESCIGLWFALEDANKNNGCLWALPGCHKSTLRQRMIKKGLQVQMQTIDETSFDLCQAIPLEVSAGTLIVLHGRLPHYSEYNHSAVSRHAYSLHAVDEVTEYSENNWLQADKNNPFIIW